MIGSHCIEATIYSEFDRETQKLNSATTSLIEVCADKKAKKLVKLRWDKKRRGLKK